MTKDSLAEIMVKRADEDHLPEDHPIRKQAAIFDQALKDFAKPSGDPKQVAKTFLGHWARTRKLWCEYSGEPLI